MRIDPSPPTSGSCSPAGMLTVSNVTVGSAAAIIFSNICRIGSMTLAICRG